MLGAVQLADGRLDTVIGDMGNVDIDSLSDLRLLALLGTAYWKHGKIADGTRSLERAHELAPDSIPIRTQLALSKMRAGKLPEALAELAAIRKEASDSLFADIYTIYSKSLKKRQKTSKQHSRRIRISTWLVLILPASQLRRTISEARGRDCE